MAIFVPLVDCVVEVVAFDGECVVDQDSVHRSTQVQQSVYIALVLLWT